MSVSDRHPLRVLLGSLTERSFYERLGWADRHIIKYISDLLVDFTDMENVHKVKNASGKRLEKIAEMLLEAELQSTRGTLEGEREIHRQIGDYTLFMLGVFPEYLKRLKISGMIHHPDVLMDHAKVGKRSYRIVSELVGSRLQEISPLYKKLSEHFELCVMGLGYIRLDLDRLQLPSHLQARRNLLN